MGLVLLALLISFLMTRYPMSSGSGIPQVKGQLQGYFKNNWFTTAFAKFIAGTLAMFAGLSLGREGPRFNLELQWVKWFLVDWPKPNAIKGF